MNRRDWLVKQGLAKPGRGKFSNAAKEALAKAEGEGMVFSDGPSKPTAATPTEPAPVAPSDPRDSAYILPSDYRFPEGEYQAVGHIDGKRKVFGMRECCNTCRVSLLNHACNAPTIHGNIPIIIERR